MASWWNGKLMKWQVDEFANWWNGKLMNLKIDEIVHYRKTHLMTFKVDKMVSWCIGKLTNLHLKLKVGYPTIKLMFQGGINKTSYQLLTAKFWMGCLVDNVRRSFWSWPCLVKAPLSSEWWYNFCEYNSRFLIVNIINIFDWTFCNKVWWRNDVILLS